MSRYTYTLHPGRRKETAGRTYRESELQKMTLFQLREICRKECNHTYYIQTLGDLNPESIRSVRSVGITAGASTPNHIIEEARAKCQN